MQSTIEQQAAAAAALHSSMTNKRASLTPGEAAFLQALLLDDSAPEGALTHASKKLDNDMLFSLPFGEEGRNDDAKDIEAPRACKRPLHNHIGLWSAFADGVLPKSLAQKAASNVTSSLTEANSTNEAEAEEKKDDDDDSIRSDEEVRHNDSQSEGSSIGDEDCAPEHFDAWEVVKDEYARDFGFDYIPDTKLAPEDLDDDENNYFKILGTSVNDKASYPHVLSPPLMDSLMTFLPEAITNQNYWLKYSLVRDGASLNTLRRYARGAPRTILAIETTDGQVFGSYTSDNWRNERGFYGSVGESFLWRMRHSRNSKCTCLFEQAQLESEIDMFFYSNENDMIQLCNDDMLAVGGGELATEGKNEDDPRDNASERSQRFGFGLSVDGPMLNGSSSPSATYRNPCLVDGGSKGKGFKIVNLEVWTLTPCMSVDAAEKLEMTQFFIHESVRSTSHSPGPNHHNTNKKKHSGSIDDLGDAEDFSQEKFYRRVGQDDASEQ